MDINQETEIMKLVKKRAELNGSCEIGSVAEEILFYKIPYSEKKRLADRILKTRRFSMMVDEDEIIISTRDFDSPAYQAHPKKKLPVSKFLAGAGVILAVHLFTHFVTHEINHESPAELNNKYIHAIISNLKDSLDSVAKNKSIKIIDPEKSSKSVLYDTVRGNKN